MEREESTETEPPCGPSQTQVLRLTYSECPPSAIPIPCESSNNTSQEVLEEGELDISDEDPLNMARSPKCQSISSDDLAEEDIDRVIQEATKIPPPPQSNMVRTRSQDSPNLVDRDKRACSPLDIDKLLETSDQLDTVRALLLKTSNPKKREEGEISEEDTSERRTITGPSTGKVRDGEERRIRSRSRNRERRSSREERDRMRNNVSRSRDHRSPLRPRGEPQREREGDRERTREGKREGRREGETKRRRAQSSPEKERKKRRPSGRGRSSRSQSRVSSSVASGTHRAPDRAKDSAFSSVHTSPSTSEDTLGKENCVNRQITNASGSVDVGEKDSTQLTNPSEEGSVTTTTTRDKTTINKICPPPPLGAYPLPPPTAPPPPSCIYQQPTHQPQPSLPYQQHQPYAHHFPVPPPAIVNAPFGQMNTGDYNGVFYSTGPGAVFPSSLPSATVPNLGIAQSEMCFSPLPPPPPPPPEELLTPQKAARCLLNADDNYDDIGMDLDSPGEPSDISRLSRRRSLEGDDLIEMRNRLLRQVKDKEKDGDSSSSSSREHSVDRVGTRVTVGRSERGRTEHTVRYGQSGSGGGGLVVTRNMRTAGSITDSVLDDSAVADDHQEDDDSVHNVSSTQSVRFSKGDLKRCRAELARVQRQAETARHRTREVSRKRENLLKQLTELDDDLDKFTEDWKTYSNEQTKLEEMIVEMEIAQQHKLSDKLRRKEELFREKSKQIEEISTRIENQRRVDCKRIEEKKDGVERMKTDRETRYRTLVKERKQLRITVKNSPNYLSHLETVQEEKKVIEQQKNEECIRAKLEQKKRVEVLLEVALRKRLMEQQEEKLRMERAKKEYEQTHRAQLRTFPSKKCLPGSGWIHSTIPQFVRYAEEYMAGNDLQMAVDPSAYYYATHPSSSSASLSLAHSSSTPSFIHLEPPPPPPPREPIVEVGPPPPPPEEQREEKVGKVEIQQTVRGEENSSERAAFETEAGEEDMELEDAEENYEEDDGYEYDEEMEEEEDYDNEEEGGNGEEEEWNEDNEDEEMQWEREAEELRRTLLMGRVCREREYNSEGEEREQRKQRHSESAPPNVEIEQSETLADAVTVLPLDTVSDTVPPLDTVSDTVPPLSTVPSYPTSIPFEGTIDAGAALCTNELLEGECTEMGCKWQHLNQPTLTGRPVLDKIVRSTEFLCPGREETSISEVVDRLMKEKEDCGKSMEQFVSHLLEGIPVTDRPNLEQLGFKIGRESEAKGERTDLNVSTAPEYFTVLDSSWKGSLGGKGVNR